MANAPANMPPERPESLRERVSGATGPEYIRHWQRAVEGELARLARPVELDQYAAAGYPDLRRATPVTVHRPWSWAHPLSSRLAQLICRYQARMLDLPEDAVTESHAMLYLGNGWCASQGHEMGLVHLSDYSGCRLTFWEWPSGRRVTNYQRNDLGLEMVVCKGEDYGYGDIIGLFALATTGSEKLLNILADNERYICSERLCHEIRQHLWAAYADGRDCLHAVPHWLAGWMYAVGFAPTVLTLR